MKLDFNNTKSLIDLYNLKTKNLKKGGIFIKPENKGKFTKWCKSQGFNSVNCACIRKGLNSKSVSIRKQANFARNFGNKHCK